MGQPFGQPGRLLRIETLLHLFLRTHRRDGSAWKAVVADVLGLSAKNRYRRVIDVVKVVGRVTSRPGGHSSATRNTGNPARFFRLSHRSPGPASASGANVDRLTRLHNCQTRLVATFLVDY